MYASLFYISIHLPFEYIFPFFVFTLTPFTYFFFFFFNDTATTEIYTLSLHDALPIFLGGRRRLGEARRQIGEIATRLLDGLVLPLDEDVATPGDRAVHLGAAHLLERDLLADDHLRSEEHTSELQSPCNLVCRLLLEKK